MEDTLPYVEKDDDDKEDDGDKHEDDNGDKDLEKPEPEDDGDKDVEEHEMPELRKWGNLYNIHHMKICLNLLRNV